MMENFSKLPQGLKTGGFYTWYTSKIKGNMVRGVKMTKSIKLAQ